MKYINMSQLKKGDVFANAISGRNRKSFKVIQVMERSILCEERVDETFVHSRRPKHNTISILGNVYLLKSSEN